MRSPNVTRLSSKYQLSIPKAVRESQHWAPGQEFAFVQRGRHLVIVPVPTLADLTGLARGADTENVRDHDD